ncbi:target of Sbf [Ophidiomyces ophidiicola]|nr:target of Sbf [Ophidiomyces ophidiicola]KAI2010311.1 target of Sbf [Ophidiomyces ophidiicola]KAI2015421.1 target of Sbf [Ophidiomyces ophidiicola]KAI2023949.1 target of Sbf [Ophidiomyces ophidiicola]KAI2027543.1 target of Sbf [Ophidiomyces ophidiicola]
MHYKLAIGAALAASVTSVAAQACDPGTARQLGGNWYCKLVDSITYNNFESSGSYDEITGMDNGRCTSQKKAYSGPLAPLDGEISLHFRGPLRLKKVAFYTMGSSEKREVKPSLHSRRHGHGHLHRKTAEKRAVGDVVTATIDGKVVQWVNNYDGSKPAPSPQAAPAGAPAPAPGTDSGAIKGSTPKGDTRKKTPSTNVGAGQWGRQAMYDAEKGTADGLTFLNHKGGQGSGVFDMYVYSATPLGFVTLLTSLYRSLGNSLSFASEDATSGAASPCVLRDTLLSDNQEIVIMSDKECKGNDCGTVRPGTVAYHGFSGASKIFLMEFSMPMSGKKGFNADMPAVWMLNAAIPRTLQYGKSECSCWKSGCGEFDVYEVLDSGNTKCKSTLHGNLKGGDSNYFKRPTDKPVKIAVFFNPLTSSAHIKNLDDSFEFGTSLDSAAVAQFSLEAALSSVFTLAA